MADKPKRKAKSKVERVAYGAYEVTCGSCKEEFEVSIYPLYCVQCGEKLEAGQ